MKYYLIHHGIKGQKWGVRRFQNEDGSLTDKGKKKYSKGTQITTKSGEKVNILTSKPKKIKGSDIGHEGYFDETVHIMYSNGKKVAIAYLDSKDGDTNINWISTTKKNEGKGYCQAMMDYVIKYSKENGNATMSLEVPDGDDNARHIYEKYGFVDDGNRYEGYLSGMRRKL